MMLRKGLQKDLLDGLRNMLVSLPKMALYALLIHLCGGNLLFFV